MNNLFQRYNTPVARDGAHDWSAAFFVEGINIGTCLKGLTDGLVVAIQGGTVEIIIIDELRR